MIPVICVKNDSFLSVSALCVLSVALKNEILSKKKEFGWFFSYSYLKVAKCLQTNSSSVNAFYFDAGRFLIKGEQKHSDCVIIVAY